MSLVCITSVRVVTVCNVDGMVCNGRGYVIGEY